MGSEVKECVELCKAGEVPIENIALFIDGNIQSVHSIFSELIRLNLFDILDELLTWFHVRNHRFYQSILSLCSHIAKTKPVPVLFTRLRKYLLADKLDLCDEIEYLVSENMRDPFMALLREVDALGLPSYLGRLCELALLYAASRNNVEMVRFIILQSKALLAHRHYNTYLCITYNCPSMLEFAEKNGLKAVSGDFYGFCEDGNVEMMKRLFYNFGVYHPSALSVSMNYKHSAISKWLVSEHFDERAALVNAINNGDNSAMRWLAPYNPRPVQGMDKVKFFRSYLLQCQNTRKEASHYDARTTTFDQKVFDACTTGKLINTKARGLRVPIAAQLAAIVCKMISTDSMENTVKAMSTGRKLFGYIFDLWLPGECLENVIREHGIDRMHYSDFARRIGSTERIPYDKQ